MTACVRLTKLILVLGTDTFRTGRGALPPPSPGLSPLPRAEGPRSAKRGVSDAVGGAVSLGFGTFKNNRNRISGKNDSKGDATAFRAKV